MMDSSKNMLLQGGGIAAIGAIIVATWGYVKTVWYYFTNLFIGKAILKNDAGSAAIAFSFTQRIFKSPIGLRTFGGYESYVHPKRWLESVAYEGITTDPVLIKYKKGFALLSLTGKETTSDNVGAYDDRGCVITIRYLRGLFNIEQFTIDAIDYWNEEKRQRNENNEKNKKKKNRINRFKIIRFSGKNKAFDEGLERGKSPTTPGISPTTKEDSSIEKMIMTGVYRLLKWNREDLQMKPEEGQSPFTGYPFPDEVGEAIQELQCWLANEKWFRSKSIPWRRGWLLYGCPGTGKSTLTRALGMSFDLPVYIFDLSNMINNDFVRAWEEMLSNTPCIALIEDMDTIFNGREYVGSQMQGVPHLTYECILNCISGVKQADGVFLIVTTNFIEKMDPALGVPDKSGKSSRPGRIDKAIHLGLMEEKQRVLLAKHILSDYTELIDETVKAGEGETAAQFQNRCAQLALSKFWKDDKFKNQTIETVHIEDQKETKISEGIDKPELDLNKYVFEPIPDGLRSDDMKPTC